MTKFPYWDDPNNKIEILDATSAAKKKYGHLFGSDTIKLDIEHLLALLDGKMLAWNDTEYSTFVVCEGNRVDMLSALHRKIREEASAEGLSEFVELAIRAGERGFVQATLKLEER